MPPLQSHKQPIALADSSLRTLTRMRFKGLPFWTTSSINDTGPRFLIITSMGIDGRMKLSDYRILVKFAMDRRPKSKW